MVRNLKELLAPCTVEEFFNETLGKDFRIIKGWPGKFAELLTWERLDELTCRYDFDYPRLHLLKDNQMVPPDSFLRYIPNRRDRKQFRALVKPAALVQLLRDGASLALDNLEEMSGRPMFELTGDLQRVFREQIRVNVYASFHTTNALDVHWDDHDVLIVQVAGRKHWTVYGPTRTYPITNDIAPNPMPDVNQKPVWEGMVEDGDFVYVPRGWWHRVDPVGEPSLHLSMGVYNRTGVELFEWLGRQMQASETFRMDLPRFGGTEERAEHAELLREEILKVLTPDVIDNYFAYLDGMAEARPRIGLPWSAIREVLPESDETRVRLAVLRQLRLRPTADGKSVSFSALGKRWKLPAPTLPLLKALNEGERSIKELCEAANGEVTAEGVRALVKKLVTQGLVVWAEPAPEPAAFRAAP